MGKHSYRKLMTRSIRETKSRFFAILCIVALGASFLCGLLSSETYLKDGADRYFDESQAMDITIRSTLGLTEEDIQALEEVDCVAVAEGRYLYDLLVEDEAEETYVARLIGQDFQDEEGLAQLTLLSGRLPEQEGECVLEIPDSYSVSLEEGDCLTLSDLNSDWDSLVDTLGQTSYTVVGIVKSAHYICMDGDTASAGDGTLDMVIYVADDSLSYECYTACYVLLQDVLALNTYSTAYKNLVQEAVEELEEVAQIRAALRTEDIRSQAQEAWEEGETTYLEEKAQALQELQEAQEEIDQGWADLEEAENTLVQGQADIDEARQQILDGQDQILAAQAQLETNRAALEAQSAMLEENAEAIAMLKAAQEWGMALTEEQSAAIDQYDSAVATIQQATQELAAYEALLEDESQELAEALLLLDEKEAEIQAGWEEVTAAKSTLEEAETTLAESWAKAEESFAEAEEELAEAWADIENLEEATWYITTREDNLGMMRYEDDTDKVGAVATIFPLFFFLVAALVALTTMTRLVEEERGRIGTLKSLGFTNAKIRGYYLLYGGIASLVGCLLGIPFGCFVLPRIIAKCYEMIYIVPPIQTPILWYIVLPVCLGITGFILLTTWIACRSFLKEKPAQLLLPKAPKAGKRIWLEHIKPLWSRIRFSYKVTLRNIFRYKKHLCMTIVGVAGCVALLVAGFGLRDSLGGIGTIQYGDINLYDLAVSIEKTSSVTQDEELAQVLGDETLVAAWGAFYEGEVTVSFKGQTDDSTFCVAQDADSFDSFIHLRTRVGHEELTLTPGQVILSEKTADNLGVQVGDVVTLTDQAGSGSYTVSGIAENYTDTFVYLLASDYEADFDQEPDYTMLYILEGDQEESVEAATVNQDTEDTLDEETEMLGDEESLSATLEETQDVEEADSSLSTQQTAAAALLACDDVLYVLETTMVLDTFQRSVDSLNMIILVLIVASGALAIIVLYNLTNVNICERRKELATLRVLGFYQKETRGYIFREVNLLGALGILVGLPIGKWLHSFIVQVIEMSDTMFGHSISLFSYLMAVGMTFVFMLLVNLIMRKPIASIDMVESMKAND